MTEQRQVAFVLSLPRSGSTMLGHFLGALAGVVCTGEVPAPLQKGRPVRCRYCDDRPCPIWGSVLSSEFVKRCYHSSERNNSSTALRLPARIWGQFRKDYEPPAAMFNRLFDADDSLQTIVDTSKNHNWINWNCSSDLFDTKYIFLTRDLRGVANSIVRTSGTPMRRLARDLTKSVTRWQRFTAGLPQHKVLQLRYEELAGQPETAGRTLCQFLGVTYSDRMLEFYRYPSHVIGGNIGPLLQSKIATDRKYDSASLYSMASQHEYYEEQRPQIAMDERWKHELQIDSLKQFDLIAGECNRSLGYAKTDA